MYKFIAALVAIIAAGVGGASLTPHTVAQDAVQVPDLAERRSAQPRIVYQDWPDIFTQRNRYLALMRPAEPGTWQIVTHNEQALLLNTATGESFHLISEEGELRWKAIPWPQHRHPAWVLPRAVWPAEPEGE